VVEVHLRKIASELQIAITQSEEANLVGDKELMNREDIAFTCKEDITEKLIEFTTFGIANDNINIINLLAYVKEARIIKLSTDNSLRHPTISGESEKNKIPIFVIVGIAELLKLELAHNR
jgi:hypothetical protein